MAIPSLNTLQIPQWTNVDFSLDLVSLDAELQLHAPAIDDFVTKVTGCFKTIQEDSQVAKTALDLKYRLLKDLKASIATCQFSADKRLRSLRRKINQLTKKLQESYGTNSHLYALTVHNRHFEEFTPQIGASQPQTTLKLNVNELEGSLKNIRALQRPLEKMRGLLELSRLIIAANYPKEVEIEKLKLVQSFVEQCLTIEEQFTALKQIQMIDKDSALNEEMTNLVDKTGKNVATYVLQSTLDWPQKIALLTRLLNDRYQKNPVKSLRSYVMSWPSSMTELKCRGKTIDVETLLKIQKESEPKEEHELLVYEYLSNLLDPSGKARLALVTKNKPPMAELCTNSAKILRSLTRFTGVFPLETFKWLIINPKVKAVPLQFDEVMKSMKAGNFDEEQLAALLKYEVVAMLLSRDWNQGDFEKTLGGVTTEITTFADKINELIFVQVKGCNTDKERAQMAKAFVALAKQLANTGEFNLCLYIYQAVDNLTMRDSKEKLLDPKQTKALKKLFDPTKNYQKLKAHKMQIKTKVSAPLVTTIPPKIEGFKQSLADLKDNISDLCKPYIGTLDPNVSWEAVLEKFDAVEAKDAVKKGEDRKELVETIQALVEQKQLFEDFCDSILTEILALKFYHTDTVLKAYAGSDFIAKLNQS
jgi:hypothetical protein